MKNKNQYIAQLEKALLSFTDGESVSDIQNNTGLPEDQCQAIYDLSGEIIARGKKAPVFEKQSLVIHVDGGIVQSVMSENVSPAEMDVVLMDYDTEGADDDEVVLIDQAEGEALEAYVSNIDIQDDIAINLAQITNR